MIYRNLSDVEPHEPTKLVILFVCNLLFVIIITNAYTNFCSENNSIGQIYS